MGLVMVTVTVMNVGIVGVGMRQPCMLMAVGVRFAWRIAWSVFVLVVLVVIVKVSVLHRLVNVAMFVAFGNVQPDAYKHENARDPKRPIEPALPEGEGERSTSERRSGKIGPCSRCTEMTERLHEKNETDAIAKETDDRYAEDDVNAGEFRADGESQSGVDDAGGETFPHRDLRWIAAGNPSGEIIVNSPAETRSGNEQRATGDGKTAFLRE